MRAGRLNQRIEIHSFTSTADSYGQANKTYSLTDTVWAGVKLLSGTEEETGSKTEGREECEFTIRYRAITRQNRIVWNSQNFEIVEINNPGQKNAQLTIRAFTDE